MRDNWLRSPRPIGRMFDGLNEQSGETAKPFKRVSSRSNDVGRGGGFAG